MNSPSMPACILCFALLLATSSRADAEAVGQVSGPIQIGPSWGQGDPAHSSATLNTVLTNHGDLPDRLIRADCPASGHMALRNGTLHQDVEVPDPAQLKTARGPQNGLDLPAGLHGAVHPVTATFDLTQVSQPLTDGALVPCTVWLAHGGQRIVIFTLGETPRPTDEP